VIGLCHLKLEDLIPGKPVEIYGPLGTRLYVRAALKTTHTNLEGRCRVHELRFRDDPLVTDEQNITPHKCELEGENILQGLDGTWKTIHEDSLLEVHAAPILHSVPCVGYIVCEKPIPGKIDKAAYIPHLERNKAELLKVGIRNIGVKLGDLQRGLTVHLPDGTVLKPPEPRPGFKVVILGDTYDPSGTAELAAGADILVHEATNAFLPEFEGIKERATDTVEMVEQRCRSHGHSTPQMAGAFATRIGAKNLILNHFSARYPGDDDVNPESARIMQAIANLAKEKFNGPVVCARDLMSIDIQRPAMDR
jgi:ribonuclease Z